MITVFIGDKKDKAKDMVIRILDAQGNIRAGIVKQEDAVTVYENDSVRRMFSLGEKLVELEEEMYRAKKGMVYKAVLEAIEKPLFELILQRTEGNQFRAAQILGINRNTMRAKIRKLGIEAGKWKIAL